MSRRALAALALTAAALSPALTACGGSGATGSSSSSSSSQTLQQTRLESAIDHILGDYSRQHERGGPGSGITDGTPNPISDPLYKRIFGSGNAVNVKAATAFIEKYGTAQQVAALKK